MEAGIDPAGDAGKDDAADLEAVLTPLSASSTGWPSNVPVTNSAPLMCRLFLSFSSAAIAFFSGAKAVITAVSGRGSSFCAMAGADSTRLPSSAATRFILVEDMLTPLRSFPIL
jgi:hypothetical protein